MEKKLNIKKGETVWTAGTGNDLHVFDSKEACEQWCKDWGRNFRPKEREVIKRYFCWTEIHHKSGYNGMDDEYYSTRRLSDLILHLMAQLDVKNFKKADPDNLPEGAWRWKIGNAPGCEWESEWYEDEENY